MERICEAVKAVRQTLKTANKGLKDVSELTANLKNYGLRGVELRPYQLKGVKWLIDHFQNGVGCILADEMGLGKTCQTISFLIYIYGQNTGNKKQPSLILCPLSVINNWRSELTRFAPCLSFVLYIGNREEREQIRQDLKHNLNVNIVLTSYELCLKDEEFLRSFSWQSLVVDEGHRLKNRESLLHQALLQMNFDYRVLLTGTPIQNNLRELYSLLCFVSPTTFKFRYIENFVATYSQVGSTDDDSDKSAELAKMIQPFIMRRLKTDVLKDLPKKSEVVLYHGLTALQKKYYKAILKKDINAFATFGKTNTTRLSNILVQLRKCVAHPYLFDGVEPEPFVLGEHLVEASGKLIVIDQLLEFLKAHGHKVLLFSQMTRVLDILQDYLTYRGYSYERLDGSVRAEERFLAVNNFNENSDTFAFLLSTRAGGQGLNLTAADTVIFVDSDFNPQNDLQAAARAHRIGQLRNVKVIRLVGRSTVEEIIMRRAEDKLRLTNAVMAAGSSASNAGDDGNQFKIEDIIKFGLDRLFATDDNSLEDVDFTTILGRTVDGEWLPEVTTAAFQPEENEDETEGDSEVNNMYMFEGQDYRHSNEPSDADCKVFEQLADAVKESQLAALEDEGRTRRSRLSAVVPLNFLPDPAPRKPQKQLSPEELEQRRIKRAQKAAEKAKAEEEEEMQRAQARKMKLAELWSRNDYKSCNLPSLDDTDSNDEEETDDAGDEDDENVKNKSIHYVIGDVLQPQNTGNQDAVIVHCVDDSGHWGSGGLFTHITNRSLLPQELYTLAGQMKDLALGDVHVVPVDDIQSRQTGRDQVALIVAHHRDKNNVLSGLKMSALSVALRKLCRFALANKASVHMPRIGHNTAGFNWYGTERLIQKLLSARGVPTYVYYFSRHQKKRRNTDSLTQSHAAKHPKTSSSLTPADDLPNSMTGFAVYLHDLPPGIAAKLSRLIIAYNGDVHKSVQSDTTHIVTDDAAVLPSDIKTSHRHVCPNATYQTVSWLKKHLQNDDTATQTP